MNRIELKQLHHTVKVGDVCGEIEPNITEDTLFVANGEVIGFYMREIPEHLAKYVEVANAEFLSDRVPKSTMNRTSGEQGHTERVQQFSTILGGVPPRPHMKRPYPSISSVHQVKSAQTFIKAMLLVAREAE